MNLQVPKLSAPLVKDIRSGEGIFEWVLGALIVAATATSHLSFAHSGTYLLILAGIKGARRGLLKLVAVQKQFGIGDPVVPKQLAAVPSPPVSPSQAAVQ